MQIEREYMGETYEEKMQARRERAYFLEYKGKLWDLYAKKNKNFIDNWQIKRLEKKLTKMAK